MGNTLARFGLVLSVVANVAFVGGYWYRTHGHLPTRLSQWQREWTQTLRQLHLSPQQRASLKASSEQVAAQLADLRSQIHQHRLHMLELLAAEQTDHEAVEQTRQAIAHLQQQMQKVVLTKIIEHKQVLTPAQQQQLFTHLKAQLERTL